MLLQLSGEDVDSEWRLIVHALRIDWPESWLTPAVPPIPRELQPPEWHGQARCRGLTWDEFFGRENPGVEPALSVTVLAATRRTHCAPCPVARQCLSWALRKPERYGIWGGTSGRQRERWLAEAAGSPAEERPAILEELAAAWLAR